MHALKARPWSVRLRLPDYGMGDIPVEQRSPSPEPIFDKNGQRVNSRVVLRRQKTNPNHNLTLSLSLSLSLTLTLT